MKRGDFLHDREYYQTPETGNEPPTTPMKQKSGHEVLGMVWLSKYI